MMSNPAPANPGPCPSPASICFVGLRNLPVLAREYAHLGAGGAELQQTLLARALARRGWRVSMVVADHGQADGEVWDDVKTYKAFRPEEGIPLVRFVHPRWTKLQAALRRADADIYYTSCAGGHLAQIALFARGRRRKVVFRIASDTDCDPKALLVRFRRDKLLYRWGLARSDLVLAQTPGQRDALARNFRRDSLVVDSLVETADGCPPLEGRHIDALWVGNLRALKRPHLFLDAAERLPRLTFHMIGGALPGAEALYTQVRLRASTLPNVTFHGFVPQHEVGAYFERARVFVSTSQIEGFPNTYLQACAHGTPVIAFLDPQTMVSTRRLGAIVADVGQLCAAITAIAREPLEWRATSERARRFMAERADHDATVSAYGSALSRLLPQSRAAGRAPAGRSWRTSSLD